MSKLILLLLCLTSFVYVDAQVSSAPNYWQVALEKKMEESRIQDSIHHAQDSLQMLWVKSPSINRPNQFIDSLKERYTVKNGDLFAWMSQFKQDSNLGRLSVAIAKPHRQVWVILVIGFVILSFSILKLSYSYQLGVIMHAIYSNAAFTQINKEENIFNRWPFVLLFILFSFVVGMFVFLGSKIYSLSSFSNPLNFYLMISLGILALVSLKITITKLLGFVFDVQSLAKEYISILYLSYFNGAIYLLPILLIFAFSPQQNIDLFFIISSLLLTVIFLLQFLRASYYTLKTYKFSKFYLFLYFCALEIGPLLILIKVLDYNLK